MSMLGALEISASGLSAQRKRLEVITSNLVNARTTRTPDGGPYKRKDVFFEALPVEAQGQVNGSNASPSFVKIDRIIETDDPFNKVYDPGHPDADSEGYVTYPNVSVVKEMVNMLSATRSYEANIQAVQAAKHLVESALELLA